MSSLIQYAVEQYNKVWDLRDPRMDGYPLMSNPIVTIALCLAYFRFVKVWGPRFMENRPAFELRGVLMVYNVCQIFINAYLFWEVGQSGWFYGKFNYLCEPVDYSDNPSAVRVMNAGYLFFLSKFGDFLDTVFFIMRKKSNQITALHVIHHGIIPMYMWPLIRFANGGNTVIGGFINAFVHVIMYSYYFVSSMGPRFQHFNLMWKKSVTICQIVQFIAVAIHSFQFVFMECAFPAGFSWWIAATELLFLGLFINFYRNAYRKKKKIDSNGNAIKYSNGTANGAHKVVINGQKKQS